MSGPCFCLDTECPECWSSYPQAVIDIPPLVLETLNLTTEDPIYVGFDYETHLIGPGSVSPRAVCLSTAMPPEDAPLDEHGEWVTALYTRADGNLHDSMEELVSLAADENLILVAQNSPFDLTVACKEGGPEVYSYVFHALSEGRIKDPLTLEKLMNLAEYGEIGMVPRSQSEIDEDEAVKPKRFRKVRHRLQDFVKKYLYRDISAGKDDADAWRLNYKDLEEFELAEWPEDAKEYAISDSIYAVHVRFEQIKRAEEIKAKTGVDPRAVEDFRTLVNFVLFQVTCEGVRIDPVMHAAKRKEFAKKLEIENLDLLVEARILKPATPDRPHAGGHRDHVEGCPKKGCDCPVKMTKGTKSKISRKALVEWIEFLCEEYPKDFRLVRNDPTETQLEKHGEDFPGTVCTDKEWIDDHKSLCPVLGQYSYRQSLQKMVTTELPRMEWPRDSGVAADFVHPPFDFLKKTGRTSSRSSDLFPSFNCQQIHPEARGCFIPREGYYFYSVDYSSMELITLAQLCLDTFGESKLAEIINAGLDAHAYLGAQIALMFSPEFQEICSGIDNTSKLQVYRAFKACEDYSAGTDEENAAMRRFYKKFRTLAKPTGLGYPGGLGPETFVKYAHAVYGVEVEPAEAVTLREIWRDTFPEMRKFHRWVKEELKDPNHPDAYAYTTPLGMLRSNCSFTKAANGVGLQAPGAEGALLGLISVIRATYDMLMESCLYPDEHGVRHRTLMFIHDELFGEARIDCAEEVVTEVARLMEEGLSILCPDVNVSTSLALMLRWDKRAERAEDENGNLIPWVPKEEH